MNGRYQLLYYVHDSLLAERVILGAVVREPSGESVVLVREPVSMSSLPVGDRTAHFRALLSSLSEADAASHLPSVLGPDVELGDERRVPSQVTHACDWVRSLLRSRETVLEWAVQTRSGTDGISVRVPMVVATTSNPVEMPQYRAPILPGTFGALSTIAANDVQQVA